MTEESPPSPERPNFYKAAFLSPANLMFLAGFALLGGVYSGFLYIGAAIELLYLGFVPNMPRFQRMVRAEQNRFLEVNWKEQEEQLLDRLASKDRSRYKAIQDLCAKIEARAGALDPSNSVLAGQNLAKLGYLQASFLRMLAALALLREYLAETDPRVLEKTVSRLNQEADLAPAKVREVKLQNVAILEQRLTHVKKADEQRQFLEASLSTLEDTLGLIGDNVVTMNNPAGIADQIDHVVTSMEENERLLGEMQAMFAGGTQPVAAAADPADGAEPKKSQERQKVR
ncbi:MAG: hypothetical protein HY816_05285 [Candidatus Wallbacteria bacterium]|nr:hypothetical protein [Candidatus Wallbacteria bacterium]